MSSHNLPAQSTPFVGRTQSLAEIGDLLNDPACRLLTLAGPGGIGKTRLALEAARSQIDCFAFGVYFVPLQALGSPDLILSAIASAIDFQFFPGGEPRDQLLHYLRNKNTLLVLDNFEHLLDGATLIADLLAAAPDVKVLATSRERLNLSSETVYAVKGLRLPESGGLDAVLDATSAKLFLESARRVRPNFTLNDENAPHLARICELVGGMPLALLLAATWVETLSLHEIADEIVRSLDFLESAMRDLPERQRSMRATFDHSWKLLTEAERDTFIRLSVFRGGFTREAAQGIIGANLKLLTKLVNRSMLLVNESGRYDVHELLRQYGEEKLHEAGSYDSACDAHAAWYADFCAQQDKVLHSERLDAALEALETEIENTQAAWTWATSHKRVDLLWQLTTLVRKFSLLRNRLKDGIQMLHMAIPNFQAPSLGSEDDTLWALYLMMLASYYLWLGRDESARKATEQGVLLLKNLENHPIRRELGAAFNGLSYMMAYFGDTDEHLRLSQKSMAICRQGGYLIELMEVLAVQLHAVLYGWIENPSLSLETALAEWCVIAPKVGFPHLQLGCDWTAGYLAIKQENYAEAKRLLEISYPRAYAINDKIAARLKLAEADFCLGIYEEARWHCEETIYTLREAGSRWNLAKTLVLLMQIMDAMGEKIRSITLAVTLTYRLDNPQVQNTARAFLTQRETVLPPNQFAAAVERGKAHNLETAADEILAEAERRKQSTQPTPKSSDPDALTERELEILHLLAEGYSNRDIAKTLYLALGTVKWYLNDINSKLGATNRTQAVARARDRKLLD